MLYTIILLNIIYSRARLIVKNKEREVINSNIKNIKVIIIEIDTKKELIDIFIISIIILIYIIANIVRPFVRFFFYNLINLVAKYISSTDVK